MIYFIQHGEGGPIKIGTARHIPSRLSSLQNGTPIKLMLLASTTGGRWRELELHKQFAKYRIRGEWFEPVAQLMECIEATKTEKHFTVGRQELIPEPVVEGKPIRRQRRARGSGSVFAVTQRGKTKWVARQAVAINSDGKRVVITRQADNPDDAVLRLNEVLDGMRAAAHG